MAEPERTSGGRGPHAVSKHRPGLRLALVLCCLLATTPSPLSARQTQQPSDEPGWDNTFDIVDLLQRRDVGMYQISVSDGRKMLLGFQKSASSPEANPTSPPARWYFIRFPRKPDWGDILDMRDKSIVVNKWYPFQDNLSFTVVQQEETLPRTLGFEVGKVDEGHLEPQDSNQAQTYVTQGRIVAVAAKQVEFAAHASPPPTAAPTSSPTPCVSNCEQTDEGFPWGWAALPVLIVAGTAAAIYLRRREVRRRHRRGGPAGIGAGPAGNEGVGRTGSQPPKAVVYTDKGSHPRLGPQQPEGASKEPPYPSPPKAGVKEAEGKLPNPNHRHTAQPSAGRAVRNEPPMTANTEIGPDTPLPQDWEARLNAAAVEIQGRVNVSTGSLQQQLDSLSRNVNSLNGLRTDVRAALDLSGEVEEKIGVEIGNLEARLKVERETLVSRSELELYRESVEKAFEEESRRREEIGRKLDELAKAVERGRQEDELYTGIIETILRRSEEAMGREVFASIAGESGANLDLGVGGSVDGMAGLEQRAGAITASLRAAVEKMRAAGGRADDKLAKSLQRADTLLSELKRVQAQLQSGKVTLNVSVPLTSQPGAGGSFLRDLSAAVRREIDKLRNPRQHWELEVERFVRGEILNVVDICDKEVTTAPGTDADLEVSLRDLFALAGLKPILPAPGEPYKPAEQELIQMIGGGPPGSSQKIARVFSRGFYCRGGDGGTQLLRKASVEIYR